MYDVIFDVADYLKMSCCLQMLVKDIWPNSSWLQPGFQVKRCSLCKPHQIHRTIETMPTWLWCTCGTPFERPHAFLQSIMVSVTVLSWRKTSLVSVRPRAKVNSCYYCDIILQEGLMPDIQKLSDMIVTLFCSKMVHHSQQTP